MADKYSTLYSRPADAPAGPFTPKSPTVARPGDTVTRVARFTGTLANLDRLFIAGDFVQGEKVVEVAALRNGDPDAANTAAVDIYFLGNASNKLATASTGLQAATPLVVGLATLPFNSSAGVDGDHLVLVVGTGALATSVTHEFVITTTIPQP